MTCPIDNTDDWKAFVNALGSEADARIAFDKHDTGDLPTVQQARELLEKAKYDAPDDKYNRRSDEFKLRRIQEEHARIVSIRDNPRLTPSEAQANVIDRLLQINEGYQQFLQANIEADKAGKPTRKTISVTSYIGSSEYTGDPTEYENFKLFGIFMHEILENLQEHATKTGVAPSKALTREFFDKAFAKFQAKTPFVINQLNEDTLFEMAHSLSETLVLYNYNNYIILPEITLIADNIDGNKIVGRLDLLMIDQDGTATIYDFKTKKTDRLMFDDGMGVLKPDVHAANKALAYKSFPMNKVTSTATQFQNTLRSAYDTWTLQLKMYENMLRQNDIPVRDAVIVSLLYQATKEDKKYQGHTLAVFSGNNFYNYGRVSTPNYKGNLVVLENKILKKELALARDRAAIDELIPISKAQQEHAVKMEKKDFPFDTTEDKNEEIIKRMQSLVDSELASLHGLIQQYKKAGNTRLESLYEKRKELLSQFRDIIDANKESYGPTLKLKLTTDAIEGHLWDLLQLSEEVLEEFRQASGHDKVLKASILLETHARAVSVEPLFRMINTQVQDMKRDKDSGINDDSDISRLMDKLNNAFHTIETNMREGTLESAVDMLKSIPGQNVKEVDKEMREISRAKLAHKQKELDKLKAGAPASLKQKIGNKIHMLVNKTHRQKTKAQLDVENRNHLTMIEALEVEVLRLKVIVDEGYELTDEQMRKYINGITDEKSAFYIGQSDAYSSFFTLRMDQFMASVSNSDRMLAAMMMRFKAAEAEATTAAQEMNIRLGFDEHKEKLMNGRTVEEVNDMITERRVVFRYDEDGNPIPVEKLTYTKPVSVEYENEFRRLNAETRRLAKKVYDLKREYNASSPAERDAKEQAYLEAEAERKRMMDEFIDWKLANVSLPYKPEFYLIQRQLPEEIRTKLQKIYLSMEALLKQGRGNEDLLDEEDWILYEDYQTEIKKLRMEAAEINPAYAHYIEQTEDFFDYVPNMNLFNRFHNKKKQEFANNPEELARWERINMVTTPNEAWYAEQERIYDEIGDIYGEMDETLKNLFEQRKKIMRPYRRDARFNPMLLSKEDAALLVQVDDLIKEAKSDPERPRLELDDYQRERLAELNAELTAIVAKQINEFYQQALEERTKLLMAKKSALLTAQNRLQTAINQHDAAAEAQARQDVEAADNAFSVYEQKYREWYNMNHANRYKSVMLGGDPRTEAAPHDFNFEKRPPIDLHDMYMDKPKPSSRWNMKVIKPEAVNPDYMELPDGTPMPKGLMYDQNGNIVPDPVNVNAKWINPKYMELMQNKDGFAFYNVMMKAFFEQQNKSYGKKIGYKVPGFQSSTVENVARHGLMETMKRGWNNYFDESLKGKDSQLDKLTNQYGDMGNKLRFRHNEQLDIEMQTQDGINAMLKWLAESHYNIAMAKVQPVADNTIAYMKEMEKQVANSPRTPEMEKRLADLKNIIDIMEFERNKFISGQYSDGSNRKIRKVMNQVFAFTSFARIGFDVANQMKNYVSGNVQSFLAAGSTDSDKYSRDDLKWAKMQIYGREGFFANYISDWGKVSGLSKDTQLYRIFNPSQKDFMKYIENTTAGKSRRFLSKIVNIQEMAYALQDKGDTEIAMTIWLAVMKHNEYRKLDNQGNPIQKGTDADGNPVWETMSAFDAYDLRPDGTVGIVPNVEFTLEDQKRLMGIVHHEVRRLQGNYAKSDQTKSEAGIFGSMLMYFKKWLVPQALNRLGHLRPAWEGSGVHYGYFRATIDAFRLYGPMETMKHLVLGGFTPQFIKNNKMSPVFAGKVAHTSRDFMVTFLFLTLGLMALAYKKRKDEEDEELSMIEGNVIRILWGVKAETISLNPVPMIGGTEEYIRNFSSFTSLTREFQQLSKIIGHGFGLAYVNLYGAEEPDPEQDSLLYQMAFKGAYFQRDTGNYEEGDPKLYKDFYDMSGLKNVRDFFSPHERVTTMQKTQAVL